MANDSDTHGADIAASRVLAVLATWLEHDSDRTIILEGPDNDEWRVTLADGSHRLIRGPTLLHALTDAATSAALEE